MVYKMLPQVWESHTRFRFKVKEIAIYHRKYKFRFFAEYPCCEIGGVLTKTYRGIL